MPAPALVFVGFMGAGKSTAAREAAAVLDARLHDSDRLLEAEFGSTIEAFFDAHGEAAFREREEALVLRLLDAADGDVIALGGGTLASARVREALGRHLVVHVEVDLETAWTRAAGKGRPLARDRAVFEARYAERASTYRSVARATLPPADKKVGRRAARALRDLADAPAGTQLLWATAASGDYPVLVGRRLLGQVPWPLGGRRFVVSDANVGDLYAGLVGEVSGLIEIGAGEEHKTLATAERVWEALVEQGATRADHVVAVGGGVVGDLAGFCASAYQRGVPVIQVPTTVVAQVDSAYGGKTGVDLPTAKNYVGAYHQPSAVVVDVATLATLPPEEHAAGYAEVVKTALIAGGALWEQVASGVPVDDATILGCARTKLAVVREDERDGGRRQVLNLGHTVGHAIETVSGFARYRHGEAVGLGLLAALRLSGQEDLRAHVRDLLEGVGLPVELDPQLDAAEIVAATAKDKKRLGEHTPFVLIHGPGDVRHGAVVAPSDVLAAVAELHG
ncbi:iron-containing alcohol dehydrogenase [Conexibacter sp. W3-3-2]|uniref:bifunctional shikimate kinase/3-dehydroquinate synthase n=1 Tax=Conexibacter sp. W3-3-2 TaxID=2675227 RepID=UPI0012B6ED8A|nr:iron-containing alcohol dehydrogenase [Conexibacter sp. W3-3-2]MTD42996.1 iron-containing alcohol dehydrogenase [Conexibacter sp. W3-3-2]